MTLESFLFLVGRIVVCTMFRKFPTDGSMSSAERENNSTFHFANTAAGSVVSSPVYRRAMKMALSMEQCTLLSLVKLLFLKLP